MAATICNFSAYLSRAARSLGLFVSRLIPGHFTNSFNRSLMFTVALLVTFLQLKCQGSDEHNPFVTHPFTMGAAVLGSVICFLAYVALQKVGRGRFAAAAQRCLMWSGCVTVASLLSVFFPDALRICIYALFALVSESEFLLMKLALRDEGSCYFRRVRSGFKSFIRNASQLPRTMNEALARD